MVRRASVAVCAVHVWHWALRLRLLPPSGSPGIPTITPARSSSATSATSGRRTRTASNVHRLTDNLAREVYPRFSPDGRSIAFSSNRYGNNDVFVIAVDRRHAEAADLPHRRRRCRRLDARLASRSSSARRAATARSRPSRRSIRSPAKGGQEQSLPVDWGYWGSFSPDGKSLVFNRHPATWSRQPLSRQLRRRPVDRRPRRRRRYTKLLGDEQYNRYWPMWGADGSIYFVGDPLPNEKSVEPGQPRRAQERQQHLQDSGEGRPARRR